MDLHAEQHRNIDLLDLAGRLRRSAAETNDETYVAAFLSAALDLELRAFSLPQAD